jgi:hypothetical protein
VILHFAEAVSSGLDGCGEQLDGVGRGDVGAGGVAGETGGLLGHELLGLIHEAERGEHVDRLAARTVEVIEIGLEGGPGVEVTVNDGGTPFVGGVGLRLGAHHARESYGDHGSDECSAICLHNPPFRLNRIGKLYHSHPAEDEWRGARTALLAN